MNFTFPVSSSTRIAWVLRIASDWSFKHVKMAEASVSKAKVAKSFWGREKDTHDIPLILQIVHYSLERARRTYGGRQHDVMSKGPGSKVDFLLFSFSLFLLLSDLPEVPLMDIYH